MSTVSTLISLHDGASREQLLNYWRGPYAQISARIKGVKEYRQYHFDMNKETLWPSLPEVERIIPSKDRIDGAEEYAMNNTALKNIKKLHRISTGKPFNKIEFFAGNRANSKWLRSKYGNQKIGYREGILIRRRSTVGLHEFYAFIKKMLIPAFAAESRFLEVRYQILQSTQTRNGSILPSSYQVLLILGAADQSVFKQALQSPFVTATHSAQKRCCEAIHAYPIAATYVFAKQGRPTLPQVNSEPKLPLEPVRRKLPPAPPRASKKSGVTPFPRAQLIPLSGYGPEDVVADGQGRLVCGVQDGRILRINPERGSEETIGNTGGRPLGLEVLPDGQLLICDAHKGLLRMDTKTGAIESLVQYVDGVPLRFCSNATAARDGTIWFTESTNRYDFEQYTGAILEHRPSGRLLRRDPDGHVEVLLEGLHFANGITLSSDEKAVLFSETDGYRLNRLWIHGPQAGKRETLIDNLPGFPDNISPIQDGVFWVAMVTSRNSLLDRLGTTPSFIRKILWRVPDRWQPTGVKTAWAMLFNEQGEMLMDLQHSAIDFHGVTGVAEWEGYLYFASTEESALLEVEAKFRQ